MDELRRADPLARARELAPIIAATADEAEKLRRLPSALVDQLHQARLFRMLYPRSVGGDEVEPGLYVLAVAELARADGSVGWCVSIANSIGLFAPYLDRDAARRVFGSPRSTCAWGPPNECYGIAVPGGYRVTGRWDFASGCRHSTWMGAHGTVIEPDGSLRLNRFGRPTIRTWLFPAEQATLLDNWNPIGLRGTASESYTVKDLFVPEELTGTREDPTLRREPGKLYAFPQQTLYSVGIASVALGIARGMLDAFIKLAQKKTPRGTGRLADNAVIQAEIARCEARYGAAQTYLVDTVRDIYDRAEETAPIDVPDRACARLAGSHAITNAAAVADWTYKAAGVDAIFPGSPFERRFRDMHTVTQQIQSRDAHYESVGQVLLGQPPEVFF
ncbi:MAG: acyl-CoA dehydrogenase family protein [Alphaproteobacteria bacterium]|nr:acyl-CoA dehydrogenase family protein [Alphaproteobacteria bacterium]